MPMRAEDWAVVDWALDEIAAGTWSTPWAVTLEYGGPGELFVGRNDAAVVEAEVRRLGRQLGRGGSGPS
jgi:hypothetical protein